MKGYLILLVVVYLVIINMAAFLSCSIDKDHSKRGRYRVRESVLLKLSALFGSFGMLVSMLLFRHKIRKPKFMIGVPVFLVIQAAILYALYYFFI